MNIFQASPIINIPVEITFKNLIELDFRVGPQGYVQKLIPPHKLQACSLKIDSSNNWVWMEVAKVMIKNIKKRIVMLSMILMNQLTIVHTNKHGGVCVENGKKLETV